MDRDESHAQMLIGSMETNIARIDFEMQMYKQYARDTLVKLLAKDNKIEPGDVVECGQLRLTGTVEAIFLFKDDPTGLGLNIKSGVGDKYNQIGLSLCRKC